MAVTSVCPHQQSRRVPFYPGPQSQLLSVDIYKNDFLLRYSCFTMPRLFLLHSQWIGSLSLSLSTYIYIYVHVLFLDFLPSYVTREDWVDFTVLYSRFSLVTCVIRSPGEGNGNPLQYSCLENPMDGGAWQATVHGLAKSRTRLTTERLHFHFTFIHSSAYL